MLRPEDIVFGELSNRVARSQLALGNFARAEQLYRESLAAREKTAGAEAWRRRNHWVGWRECRCCRTTMGRRRSVISVSGDSRACIRTDHPQVANDVMNLALLSYRRRDYATALARTEGR